MSIRKSHRDVEYAASDNPFKDKQGESVTTTTTAQLNAETGAPQEKPVN